ncbi:tape measure protein [Acinetobacter sp. ULE_I001]|uniref:tape measure protein n=1 Tax=unclassified Acinetobacter TaxID=196816 RepID=UPI003AF505D3
MANEVEVKITASTDALSDGMNEATSKVQSAAADINRIADTIKNAFDGVRDSLKNIDVSLNIDMSDVQQKLSNAANTIKSRINSIVDEASIKLKIDTTALNTEIGHAESLIRARLSSLPIQNVRLDIDVQAIRQRLNQINNQSVKVKVGLDLSTLQAQMQQARTTITSTLQSTLARAIQITVNLPLLASQLSRARTMINNALNQLRSSNINLNTVINIDATSTLLRTSLDRLKTSIDLLRNRLNTGSGSGAGPSGGGGGPPVFAGVGGMFTGLMAVTVSMTAAISGLKKVISTQREFDILNAQLETPTKSSEGAKEAFATLQEFAKKTPYSLEQAVTGFTKLVNLGLTPSERAMMSYGNTSAAMGKDLMQLIEAVADASTGEFERLKEFGIKAKQQGDKVSLTFHGVTKTIGNNAKEIESYLIAIGENEFAGAMAKRVDTLDGAIASLSDTWDSLFRAVSNLGVGDVIKRAVNTAEDSISSLIKVLESGAVEAALRGMANAFNIFSNSTQSDMNNMKSAFSGLGDYLVSSWESTLNEINALGNIFSTARSYVQKAAVSVAAGVDIVSDPFNRNTTNQQKTDNWKSSLDQIDAELSSRTDALKNSLGMNTLLKVQSSMIDIGKSITPNDDPLAKFKIKGDSKSDQKDDKKTAGGKESKYEPSTYSDLRIKSPEAYAGGKAHQGVLDLAGAIQDKFQITRFTAFNDNYHKGTSSKHAKGLALDFGLQDSSKSGQVTSDLRSMLGKNGVNAQVLDEYKNPSKRATGGHIHVSFNSQADADKYLALVKSDKVKGNKKSSSDSEYERYLDEQTRNAEKAEKERLDLKYKYASEQEKLQLELIKELDRIERSTLNSADKKIFKEKAEKESQDKIVALNLEAFEKIKAIYEQEIQSKQDQSQRIYEQEKARIQAALDAGRISNVEKVQLEKQLEDQLYQIKRDGLLARLDLENQQSSLTGKGAAQATISNNIAELDSQKTVSDFGAPNLINDAQMNDFEKKFGGLTSRMSNLWDQGMQSMMNGTLTWKNALSAIYSELAAEFIQKLITAPLKEYVKSMAPRLAAKLGLIKAETALEVSGQAAQTTAVVTGEGMKTAATSTGVFARLGLKLMEVLKSIMMSAWEAMAAAWAALSAIPIVGPALGVAAGIAAFAGVSAIVGKVSSARGGFDIPVGVNPMTQLHEEEMVLPKQHANTIRALGKSVMGDGSMPMAQASTGGGEVNNFNFQSWDSKDLRRFAKKHGREFVGGMKGYKRNFGK